MSSPSIVKITGGGCCDLWPSSLTKVGETLFFTDYDSAHGTELWKSDGTSDGTVLVKDINPGGDDGWESYLTDVNGTLFFVANDGTHGSELWKSDGTESGTVMVKDINPGSNDSNAWHLTNANGTLFFSADDGTHGAEVWKSDGTISGTVMVKDIVTGSGSSSPQNLTYNNGLVYFTAQPDLMSGSTIYKTDGTAGGTIALTMPGMATPNSLFSAGDILYYTANNIGGNTGVELGKTDGTDSGTVLVKDINPGGDSSYPQNFADIDGTLYFSATDGTHGQELWKSDGSSAGTVMIKDINPGDGDSSPVQFFNNGNGTIYFDASDGPHGMEFWKTDGTSDGTVMVKDINQNNGDSWAGGFTNVYGITYFDATNISGGKNGNSKYQLWKTDGTESGTTAVADLNPGGDDAVSNLTKINNTLSFTADDGVNGTQLWKFAPSPPDHTPPTVPGIPQANVSTDLTSQVWSWTASTDTGSGVKQYDWRIEGGPSGTTTNPTITTNLPAGNWKFHVKAEDNVGNQSAENSSLLGLYSPDIDSTVIDNSVPLVQIIVPDGVGTPTLDMSSITTINGGQSIADIDSDIHLKARLALGTVTVDIPAGSNITGDSGIWSTNLAIPAKIILSPGQFPKVGGRKVVFALEVGSKDAPLAVSRGVRIGLEGQIVSLVGSISASNIFTEIANICADDSQAAGDALATGQACKINPTGNSLVLWTRHFTEFVTYNLSASSTTTPSDNSMVPKLPDTGFFSKNNIFWHIIVLAGIITVSTPIYIVRRKQKLHARENTVPVGSPNRFF
ncbi:MAG TPA: ELWxxDGT repeat protein [Patescibacteria group bacterium]|nr:ELWxxDGT repeat protein [Patescibacteria group bacterium]